MFSSAFLLKFAVCLCALAGVGWFRATFGRGFSRIILRYICTAVGLFLSLPVICSPQSSSVPQRTVQPSRIVQPIDEQQRVTLAGNTHPLARAIYDTGAAPDDLAMNRMLLVLRRSPEQERAVRQLLDDQQNKATPRYRQWLTPSQFGQQFGPSDADVQAIIGWLQGHGFTVTGVSPGKGMVEFSGTAVQVRQTFQSEIHRFTMNGVDHWANASDPQIPAALAPVVVGVQSLNNFGRHAMHVNYGLFKLTKQTGQIQSAGPAQGDFTFFDNNCVNSNGVCYALGPYDFATIYNVLPLWTGGTDGTGQTIAVVGQSNINIQDVRDFRNMFGLPANDPQIVLDGGDPGLVQGDETESDLDVQWSGAVAKGATVDFVTSASTNSTAGVDLSAQYVVDHDLAPILSESYGACEFEIGSAGNQFYNQLWEQAAAEGITVVVSSGDSGAAGCDEEAGPAPQPAHDGLQVSGIASTPFNVAVGGTDFVFGNQPSAFWNSTNDPTTQASAKSYIPEIPWNDSCTNPVFVTYNYGLTAEAACNNSQALPWVVSIGGGGGKSSCTASNGTLSSCSGGYAKPSWQSGTGVPSDGARDIPDVSLFASNGFNSSFYIICEKDSNPQGGSCEPGATDAYFLGIGGTSSSAPSFAGIMAMVEQKTQARQGNANYIFYSLAAQMPAAACNSDGALAPTCVFNDVTQSTNAMPCATGSPNCTTNTKGDAYGILSGYTAVTGYDQATGLGTINAANLVNQWSSVTFRPSTTTLALNPTSFAHGSPVTLNVSVVPASGSGTPTGLVSLIASSGTEGGAFTLSGGSISASTQVLPGGSYTVTAHYAGDGAFAASDSPGISVNVTPEASTTSLTAFMLSGQGIQVPVTSVPYGTKVSLQGNVAPQSGNRSDGPITGTVAFTDQGQPVTGSPVAVNPNGVAMLTGAAVIFGAGSHSVTAAYTGDSSYTPSSAPTPATFTVTAAITSVTLQIQQNKIVAGDPDPLTANISTAVTAGDAPGGTVTFMNGSTPVGSPVPVTSGFNSEGLAYASATLAPVLPFGNYNITAVYNGDANYAASTSAATKVQVQALANSTLTSSPSGQGFIAGTSITLIDTITPVGSGLPAPTGSVQFLNGIVTLATVPITNGQAQFTVTPSSGPQQFQAVYPGDANYAESISNYLGPLIMPLFTLSANPSLVNITSPGGSASTTVTVTAQNGFTGVVSFMCSSLPAESTCSFSPSIVAGSGSTTLTITTTAPQTSRILLPRRPTGILWSGGAIVLFAVLSLVLSRRSDGRRRQGFAIVMTVAALMLLSVSCGGGGGGSSNVGGTGGSGTGGTGGSGGGTTNPGTPTGVSNVTLTGTSGTATTKIFVGLDVQ